MKPWQMEPITETCGPLFHLDPHSYVAPSVACDPQAILDKSNRRLSVKVVSFVDAPVITSQTFNERFHLPRCFS